MAVLGGLVAMLEAGLFYFVGRLVDLLDTVKPEAQTRTMGLFEDGVLIATMKLILFSMNIFGVMQPACGLMALDKSLNGSRRKMGRGQGCRPQRLYSGVERRPAYRMKSKRNL